MLASLFDNLVVEGIDMTYLATAFAFNVTLSSVDSAFAALSMFVISWFNSRVIAKKNALDLSKDDDEDLSFEIDRIRADAENRLGDFRKWAKRTMIACAILAVVCMLYPYTAQITGVLMLPFPLYIVVAAAYCRYVLSFRLSKCVTAASEEQQKKTAEEYVRKVLGR